MNFLYALDAKTGKPIKSFGKDGRIDLQGDLGRDPTEQSVALTTPGIVYKDMIIVGGRNAETLPAAPAMSERMTFAPVSCAGLFIRSRIRGNSGMTRGRKMPGNILVRPTTGEAWPSTQKRGIVFVPTGSAAADFYGGNRVGDNLFADCEIALNADTGERIWHFQGCQHDIWDRDFPTGPLLVTVKRDGNEIDAVAQASKQGFVYLFNRTTGESLFPIEYNKYPKSDVPGEVTRTRTGSSDKARSICSFRG